MEQKKVNMAKNIKNKINSCKAALVHGETKHAGFRRSLFGGLKWSGFECQQECELDEKTRTFFNETLFNETLSKTLQHDTGFRRSPYFGSVGSVYKAVDLDTMHESLILERQCHLYRRVMHLCCIFEGHNSLSMCLKFGRLWQANSKCFDNAEDEKRLNMNNAEDEKRKKPAYLLKNKPIGSYMKLLKERKKLSMDVKVEYTPTVDAISDDIIKRFNNVFKIFCGKNCPE